MILKNESNFFDRSLTLLLVLHFWVSVDGAVLEKMYKRNTHTHVLNENNAILIDSAQSCSSPLMFTTMEFDKSQL